MKENVLFKKKQRTVHRVGIYAAGEPISQLIDAPIYVEDRNNAIEQARRALDAHASQRPTHATIDIGTMDRRGFFNPTRYPNPAAWEARVFPDGHVEEIDMRPPWEQNIPHMLPRLGEHLVPDGSMPLHDRDEMMAVSREARAILNSFTSTEGLDMLGELLPKAVGRSAEEVLETHPALVLSFQLGLAFSEAGRRRRWSATDTRTWNGLINEAHVLARQAPGNELAALFLAHVGLWVGTRGAEGLDEILASLNTDTPADASSPGLSDESGAH
jgi:hypothetical protein